MKRYLLITILALAACAPSAEDEKPVKTEAMAVELNDAQRAYAKANAKMHSGMNNIPADADQAFMVGMIPHHQGAVDMAQIVLEHGKDTETRALAETIINAQKTEIAQMKAWLQKRGIEMPEPSAEDHAAMGH